MCSSKAAKTKREVIKQEKVVKEGSRGGVGTWKSTRLGEREREKINKGRSGVADQAEAVEKHTAFIRQ